MRWNSATICSGRRDRLPKAMGDTVTAVNVVLVSASNFNQNAIGRAARGQDGYYGAAVD